jgi:hypothetical protein
MPRLYSVFDTNIYRGLGSPALEEIRQTERGRSVQPVASPWVSLELLVRAGGPDVIAATACRAALLRLVEHCRTYNGSQYVVPVLGTADRQVSYSLFGGEDDDPVIRAVTSYISDVVATPLGTVKKFEWWDEVDDYVRKSEEALERNIWTHVIQASVPEARTWDALTRSPARLNEVLAELDSEETLNLFARSVVGPGPHNPTLLTAASPSAADRLIERARKPLLLYRQLIREVLTRGLDLSQGRNRNAVWDIKIALAAVIFSSLDPRRVCLVTDDQMVLDAARATGYDTNILSLSAYRILLADPNPIEQHFEPAA